MLLDEYRLAQLCGDGREPVSKFLDYFSYTGDTGLFDFSDISNGFTKEIYPLPYLTEQSQKTMSYLFSSTLLKPGDNIQIINIPTDNIEPSLYSYLGKKTNPNPLMQDYSLQSASYIMNARRKGFKGMPERLTPKDFRVFVTFRSRGINSDSMLNLKYLFKKGFKGAIDILKGNMDGNIKEYDQELERTLDIKKEYETLIGQAQTGCREFGPEDLQWYFNQVFGNPEGIISYNPNEMICDQLIDSSMPFSLKNKDYIIAGNNEIAIYSIKDYPRKLTPNNTANLIGSIEDGNLQMPANCGTVLNVTICEQITTLNFLEGKKKFYEHFKRLPFAAEKVEQFDKMITDIKQGNSRHLGYLSFFAIRRNDNKYDIKTLMRNMESQIGSVRYRPQVETYIKYPMLLGMMPMFNRPSYMKFFRRNKELSAHNCAAIAPFYGDNKGVSNEPSIIGVTPRAQTFGIDIFQKAAGAVNYILLIEGMSGMGKSFLQNAIAYNYRAEGAIVIQSEVAKEEDASYKNSCEFAGGRYINLTSRKFTMNPFPAMATDHELTTDEWYIFSNMVQFLMSPEKELDMEKKGWIEWGIKKVAEGDGRKGTMDKLRLVLNEKDESFANCLESYTKDGLYGDLFGIDKPPITYDEQYTSILIPPRDVIGRTLVTAIYLNVIYSSASIVYGKKFRGIRKIVDYDECQNAGDNYFLGDLLQLQSRQYRRSDGSMICGMQNVTDAHVNEQMQKLQANAAFEIIFPQKPEVIEKLVSEKKMDKDLVDMIKKLHSIDGVYSEFIFKTPNGSQVVRYPGNPYDKVLFGSSVKEKGPLEKMMENGSPIAEAVKILAKEMWNAA